MKKTLKILQGVVWTALLAFLLLIALTFLPIKGNYKIFTVQSGSMEPAIHTGSIILVKAQKDYNVGDIVTRKTNDPKVTITHRIISKNETGGGVSFETKGDANDDSDGESLSADKIVGREFFTLPFIGYPIGYARTVPGLIILIVIPAVVIVYEELNKIKEEIKRLIAKRRGQVQMAEVSLEENTIFTRPSQNNSADSQPAVKKKKRMGL
jgi:signal peptidase I